MSYIDNPWRGSGLAHPDLDPIPWPSADAAAPKSIMSQTFDPAPTPWVSHDGLAHTVGVDQLWIKDERNRMGLGSFKALGAAYVIACDAAKGDAKGQGYVTASAGNHGLSVAAGAQAFGARAVVYLADTVPEAFADRLRAKGAEVRREGAVYEDSMAAAAAAASAEGLRLLSDSSWSGYSARPHRLMEGYCMLMAEAISQCPEPATHIYLQAGVGGLAAACAVMARQAWGDAPEIVVVEPTHAPALHASVQAGAALCTSGPESSMGRLDCKEPSLIALKGLARDADGFLLITEAQGQAAAQMAAQYGFATTASGAAGLAGAMSHAPGAEARVLIVLSEGPEA
jgi:diaminopropionate ammonia-lyase